MSNIIPSKPSFVFGYWRPWKENSNVIDSYLDYTKDVSLVKYGADTLGKYINQASKEQVQAIDHLGQAIGRGMSDINDSLGFLNRNMDIQIEQQKLSNLLLQNISELLRVPDSEKERQHSIELGIKFFVNAIKDPDLYADALEELLKAESLMKQDYFVLHRIGCIYLHVNKYINPEKALDYFLRAAKYAIVESDPGAVRLANALTNNFNTANSELNNYEKQIGLLAADSYEKAAFAAYVLGRFEDAVNYQSKSVKLNNVTQYRFLLAKYQVRNGEIDEGVKNLSKCIDDEPVFAVASLKEIDLINEPSITEMLSKKNKQIDSEITNLIDQFRTTKSDVAKKNLAELKTLSTQSYEVKVSKLIKYRSTKASIETKIKELKKQISELAKDSASFILLTIDDKKRNEIISDLQNSTNLQYEEMKLIYSKCEAEISKDRLQIDSIYAGGIVFYIDKSGKHGLVCSEIDFGEACWGGFGKIGANEDGIAEGKGIKNTKKIVKLASWHATKSWFTTSQTPAKSAARLCLESNHNNFSDWYLPTISELKLIYNNLAKSTQANFIYERGVEIYYWSSTESCDLGAWFIDFKKGSKSEQGFGRTYERYMNSLDSMVAAFNDRKRNKNIVMRVRGVRAF